MAEPLRPKRPRDFNQLAASVVREATDESARPALNEAAATLGRVGGLKGGPARAAKLSPERRRQISQQAAAIRWGLAQMPLTPETVKPGHVKRLMDVFRAAMRVRTTQGALEAAWLRYGDGEESEVWAAIDSTTETAEKAIAELLRVLDESLGPAAPSGTQNEPPVST